MPKLTDKADTPVELLEAAYRHWNLSTERFSLPKKTRRPMRHKIGWIKETGGHWRRKSAQKKSFLLIVIPL